MANVPTGTGAPGIREVEIRRPGQEGSTRDLVAVEEPMEVRVNGESLAVIMRTPGADRDLAAGFLLAEDFIRGADEIGAIEYCQDVTDEGRDNTINVTVIGDAAYTREITRAVSASVTDSHRDTCSSTGRTRPSTVNWPPRRDMRALESSRPMSYEPVR